MRKKRFLKMLSLFTVFLLLFSVITFGAIDNNKLQFIKSYDELKQVYLKILGNKQDSYRNYYDAFQPQLISNSTLPSFVYSSVPVFRINAMVKGVEKSAASKTYGNYKYTCTVSDQDVFPESYGSTTKIDIISISKNGDMKIVSTINASGIAYGLYVKGNKLVIVARDNMFLDLNTNKYLTNAEYNNFTYKENRFISKNVTLAEIYDISNPLSPKKVRTIKQDGFYYYSWLIGDNLYMTSVSVDHRLKYTKTSEMNTYAIAPQINDSAFGNTNMLVPPQNICMFPDAKSISYTIISGFNINANTKVNSQAILGEASRVIQDYNNLYVTQNSLYIINTNSSKNTSIFKYQMINGTPKLYSYGRISGQILNKYSIDEYGGNLRIATTKASSTIINDVRNGTGYSFPKSAPNDDKRSGIGINIYILDPTMEVIGKLENAFKEQINKVQFNGTKGYVVTSRKNNPLVNIDLSNPKLPKISGQ